MKYTFLLLALVTFLSTSVRAQNSLPVTQTLDRADVVSDLNRTVAALEKFHCNAYRYATRAEIAALRDDLTAALPASPTRMDAYRALSQLTCAFGDGHTRVWDRTLEKNYRTAGGTYLPLQVNVGPDELTVRADLRGGSDNLAGRQITAINGVPADRLIRDLSVHASRETAALDRTQLSANFRRYLWLTYDWAQGDFTVDFANGQRRIIAGMTAAAIAANRPAREKTPVVTTEILTNDVAYLRVTNFEGRPATFKKRFQEAFAEINASGASHLVLDLRGHGGGDSRVGTELARYFAGEPFRPFAYSEWKATPELKNNFKNAYLPGGLHWALPLLKGVNPNTKAIYSAADGANARVDYPLTKPYGPRRTFAGKVTLLMDQNTFSAGTCFAAMFKDYQMGTIVGQESGNLASFHADGLLRMGLMDDHLQLQISTSYLVRPSGDETPAPVQPDVRLEPGTDALEYVLRGSGLARR